MNHKIFAYCERGTDPGFWAEPLNAVTNLAFIIAAVLATRLWLQAPPGQRGVFEGFLVLLLYAMGLGSFLFHTFAEPWAAIADTVPIGIFMVSYLAYALRRYLGVGWIATFAVLVAFFISLWQSSVFRCGGGPCLNGSLAYVPALVVLMVIGALLVIRRHPAGWSLITAGIIFAVSLTARTIDRDICGATAMVGTHFLWHIFNATLLYVLARAALLHGRRLS
jgi:hypothetical protein